MTLFVSGSELKRFAAPLPTPADDDEDDVGDDPELVIDVVDTTSPLFVAPFCLYLNERSSCDEEPSSTASKRFFLLLALTLLMPSAALPTTASDDDETLFSIAAEVVAAVVVVEGLSTTPGAVSVEFSPSVVPPDNTPLPAATEIITHCTVD